MTHDDLSDQNVELLTRVATLYYVENATQAEIGALLRLSRPKIGRLLQQARDQGIVEISIRTHPSLRVGLEVEFAARFGLEQVILVADQGGDDQQRILVARAAAEYLARVLHDGSVVAVGMGRNVGAVPQQLPRSEQPKDSLFVCAIGGSPQMGAPVNPSDVCRRLAEKVGGIAESLYAPAYAESQETRELFLQHRFVRETLAKARKAEYALIGIGDARDDSAVVKMGCVSVGEMAQLRVAGAVGDVLGSFFDLNGVGVSHTIGSRVVGLRAEELRSIRHVVAVVSESDKTSAILGTLRSGIIDVLVTAVSIAERVLAANGTPAQSG